MRIRYFRDTDTLYIELHGAEVWETRDLDDDTIAEFDEAGRLCAITVEHAKERSVMPDLDFARAPESVALLVRELAEWAKRTGAFKGVDADQYVRDLREGSGQ